MSETEPLETTALPVTWNIPRDIPTTWANNMTIQLIEHSFILTFFQTIPPLVMGSVEEQQRQMLEAGAVPADGKVRVVVPIQKLPDIISVLLATQERYNEINQATGDQ